MKIRKKETKRFVLSVANARDMYLQISHVIGPTETGSDRNRRATAE